MNFQQIMDCTEVTISMIKDHSSLVFYHIKDEPDTSDFVWLKGLRDKIYSHDSEHLNYINFLPNWSCLYGTCSKYLSSNLQVLQ